MQLCREEGRLNWIFNILDGRTEQENVLFRSSESDPNDDYLLLPDLNWDRSTIGSLHLLALVQRRDIWSVRDLRKSLAPWLRRLHSTLASTVTKLYPGVERDMLKFYIHYQPTYYHFHIHIVHVNLDATATQATGKALGLENVLSQLENLREDGEDAGMHSLELTYTVGEESELWTQIFRPLKEGKPPTVGSG
jgi:m7GpppX diphosphatase